MKIRMAAFAACTMLICFCAGARGELKVTIHSEASGIPDNVVAEIIAENPDAQEITFLKCEDASPKPPATTCRYKEKEHIPNEQAWFYKNKGHPADSWL